MVVLFWINFHGVEEYVGVYSSEEKANERIAKFSGESRMNFRTEEVVVDEM